MILRDEIYLVNSFGVLDGFSINWFDCVELYQILLVESITLLGQIRVLDDHQYAVPYWE